MRHSYANGFGPLSFESKKHDYDWTFYRHDGTGRDTYISYDNGAFQHQRHLSGKSTYPDTSLGNKYTRDIHPPITSKHINYH